MVLPDRPVADPKHAQFILRKSCLLQRDVFGDRVVLAITFSSSKSGKRRAPPVRLAVLGVIAKISDSGVDGPVGLIELRATGLWFDGLDQPQKLRGIGRAAISMLTACVEDGLLLRDIGFDTAPFAPDHSLGR